jgi:hypothetical protein
VSQDQCVDQIVGPQLERAFALFKSGIPVWAGAHIPIAVSLRSAWTTLCLTQPIATYITAHGTVARSL